MNTEGLITGGGVALAVFAGFRIHQRRQFISALIELGVPAHAASEAAAAALPFWSTKTAPQAIQEYTP